MIAIQLAKYLNSIAESFAPLTLHNVSAVESNILLLEVIYIAAQDQHCNGKTDARSIPHHCRSVFCG